MYELIYTSAPQGLRPGTSGYTVVAQTAGMPSALVGALEGLAQYRHRVVARNARADNPVIHAHYVLSVGYQPVHVLARVVDTGLDYSGRGNFLAHLIAATDDGLPPAGPSWVLGRTEAFRNDWTDAPATLPPPGRMRAGELAAKPCRAWERATGDAGWGGVLAAATDPARPAIVVIEPGQDALALVSEALALLPPDERWAVTFSTYFLGTMAGVRCQWRFVPNDAPDLPKWIAAGPSVVIRADRPADEVPDGPLVEAARAGTAPVASRRTVTPAAASPPVPASRLNYKPEPAEPAVPPRPARRSEPRPAAAAIESHDHPAEAGGGTGRLLIGLAMGAVAAAILFVGIEAASGYGLWGWLTNKRQADEDTKQKWENEKKEIQGIAQRDADLTNKTKGETEAFLRAELKKVRDDNETKQGTIDDLKKQLIAANRKPKDDHKEPNKEPGKIPKSNNVAPVVAPPPPPPPVGVKPMTVPENKKSDAEADLTIENRRVMAASYFAGQGGVQKIQYKLTFDQRPTIVAWGSELTLGSIKDEGPYELSPRYGKITVASNKTWSVELQPVDAKEYERTPVLRTGFLEIALQGKTGSQYHLLYNPVRVGKQVFTKQSLSSKDNLPVQWKCDDFKKQIVRTIEDVKYYRISNGLLGFSGNATIMIDDKVFVLAPDAENPFPARLLKKVDGGAVIVLELDNEGQLLLTTPAEKKYDRCEIETVAVVRPVSPAQPSMANRMLVYEIHPNHKGDKK